MLGASAVMCTDSKKWLPQSNVSLTRCFSLIGQSQSDSPTQPSPAIVKSLTCLALLTESGRPEAEVRGGSVTICKMRGWALSSLPALTFYHRESQDRRRSNGLGGGEGKAEKVPPLTVPSQNPQARKQRVKSWWAASNTRSKHFQDDKPKLAQSGQLLSAFYKFFHPPLASPWPHPDRKFWQAQVWEGTRSDEDRIANGARWDLPSPCPVLL